MAVTNKLIAIQVCLLLLIWSSAVNSAVIPEDRSDLLFHSYSGGGITVTGPSLLVRKGFKDKVSLSANYYQDVISSASIDVLVSGSKYSEERDEYSLGIDYLHDSTTMTVGFGNSTEGDYISDTVSFGLSQDFFGDMTTLSLAYAQGEDTIMRNGTVAENEIAFQQHAKRKRFSLGLTQVLSKNWIIAFSAETVVDAGFLNNAYRSYHYRDQDLSGNITRSQRPERYPETHNSDAFAIRSMYYLPYRASIRFEARTYTDSWGIKAQNYELRYIHPIRDRIIIEVKGRSYSQTQADFYSDLFDYVDAFDFLARDKELSTYSDFNFGLGVTYDLKYKLPFADKESISFYWDFMSFDYDNFLDACASKQCAGREAPTSVAGEEPSYAFQANILRIFFSIYY